MKNAFLRIGYTCASLMVAGGLMTTLTTTAATAEMHDLASVTLSSPIQAGSATLPSGHYTISSVGGDIFLLESDKGDRAFVMGHQIENNTAAPKTEVLLKSDGEGLRLDKLYFEGDTTGYEFRQ
jgi:hypothetical protein